MLRALLICLLSIAIACGVAPASIRSASGAPASPGPLLIEPADGSGIRIPDPVVSHYGLRVLVPQLGINLPIVEGEGGSGEPPVNVAAHYPGMKWPGEGGRSFLYAHARPGMFGPLFKATVGQEVDVLASDGSKLRYRIRQYTPTWPVTDVSILTPTDHEELVLYTCTSWTYSDPKIVAIAEPISP